jgi:NHL repeat
MNDMKRYLLVLSLFVFGAMLGAGTLKLKAQFGPPSPERQAAMAKQKALEESTPQLKFTEETLPLMMPDHTIGETEGVSINSKGHLFVYSRTGKGGSSRGGTAAELFEFDQNMKYVKMWAPDNYAASFAHSVRNDKYDNVYMVDEGSSMVIKFDPNGMVKMTLGRKPEAIDYMERFIERGEKVTERYPVGTMGTFDRPTDIAWDPQDNMYISDGYGNSRVVKISKDGVWMKAVGTHGSGQDQFSTPHGIATDAVGNVYVADRGNFRIQVYDYDLKYKKSFENVAMPWTVQVTPKYIYSGDGTGKIYRLDHEGKLLGWIQSGLGKGQTGCIIHELYAVSDDVLIRGSCSEWDVTKITFK